MWDLQEMLWYVFGPVTVLRLAELVLFGVAAWHGRRKNWRAAFELVCIAWTVAAFDSARNVYLSLTVISGPPIPSISDALTGVLIDFPLPLLMTLVLCLLIPHGLTAGPVSASTKALIAIPLIAILDVLLIAIVLLPLIVWS